jgi:hypothetical protein
MAPSVLRTASWTLCHHGKFLGHSALMAERLNIQTLSREVRERPRATNLIGAQVQVSWLAWRPVQPPGLQRALQQQLPVPLQVLRSS